MRNVRKVLLMINLLNNRQYVSLKTFKTVCGISRRSVFRYLNYISEANIPVLYDRELKAYRLSSGKSNSDHGISIEEHTYVLVGLMLLSSSVDSAYRYDVDMLIDKLISQQPFPFEEIVSVAKENMAGLRMSEDLTDTLSWTLINAAIICRKKIRIHWENPEAQDASLEIVNPSLWFRKNWHIVDSGSDEPSCELLSEVSKVSLV